MNNIIAVSMHQLHDLLPSAIRYKQAIVVHNASLEQLRAVCRHYTGVVAVAPFSPVLTHEEQLTLVCLMRPGQREQAMLVPYWQSIPRPLLARVMQVRLVAK